MKSQHFAVFDLGAERAKCIVLRQVFHTRSVENPDFIVVSRDSKGKNCPLSPKAPHRPAPDCALASPLERAEYVKDC